MPTISKFFGIVIRMYFDDHGIPHFHAYYAEHAAKVAIDSLEVIEGRVHDKNVTVDDSHDASPL